MSLAAIEEDIMALRSRDSALDYIIDTAKEGVSLAKQAFDKAGIPYDMVKDYAFLNDARKLYLLKE